MNKTSLLKIFSIFIFAFILSSQSFAAKKKGGKGSFAGGSLSVGLGLGLTTTNQSGLNTMIGTSKTAVNSSTSNFSSGMEYIGFATFLFSNNFVAIQLRPTYFTQSTSGSGTDGSHSYDLSGYTVFPLVRIIPLSNDIIDFYMQFGLGYGKLNGSITNGARKAEFTGSNFGAQVGLGANFCIIPEHCFGIEGNYRYLPIERNIVSTATGGLPYGASQASADRELEDLNGSDVATSLSGISGILAYTYNF